MSARLDDIRLLAMLRLRGEGLSAGEIAKRFGWTATAVRTATNRVRDEDIELSGEDPALVAEAYW